MMFLAQIAVLFLFIVAAIYLATFRNGVRLSRVGALIIVIAVAALVSQFLALQNISVDGSTVR